MRFKRTLGRGAAAALVSCLAVVCAAGCTATARPPAAAPAKAAQPYPAADIVVQGAVDTELQPSARGAGRPGADSDCRVDLLARPDCRKDRRRVAHRGRAGQRVHGHDTGHRQLPPPPDHQPGHGGRGHPRPQAVRHRRGGGDRRLRRVPLDACGTRAPAWTCRGGRRCRTGSAWTAGTASRSTGSRETRPPSRPRSRCPTRAAAS